MVPIAIAGIFLAFLAVELIIQAIQARRGEEVYGFFMPDPPLEASDIPPNFARMVSSLKEFGINPPSNVFLHPGQTWAAVEGSGEAMIGVNALASKAIGKVDGFALPEVGQAVRQGERLFSLRQGERTAEFVAPMDGTISSINEALAENGSLDSSDWVCKVQPENLSISVKAMKFAEDAIKWTYDELSKLQEMVAMQIPRMQTVGITMQDGPLALDKVLETLDDETWNMFQERFLNTSQN
jgi:glycine cleavage system H protein